MGRELRNHTKWHKVLFVISIMGNILLCLLFCFYIFFNKLLSRIVFLIEKTVIQVRQSISIGMIFSFLFLLLIFGIYIYKPFYLLFDYPEYTSPGITTNKPVWLLENFIIFVLSVCLMLFVIYIARKDKIAANIGIKTEKIIVSGVVLWFFILIFINKLSLFSDVTFADNTIIRSGAYGIMNDGVIPESVQSYLLFFKNNRGIVLLLGLLGRIANDLMLPYRLLWIFIDSVFIALAVLFVYLTVKLFCNSRVSLITLALSFAFLFFSACITPLANTRGDWYTCYTDSSSMPFITISVYCFTRFFALNDNNRKKTILVLLGSVSSAIGFLFKPTALIPVIAFTMIFLLNRKETIKKSNLLLNVTFVIFGLCFVIVPFETVYDYFETIDAKPASTSTGITHMLVLGMLNSGQNINENGVMVFNDPPSLDPFKDRGRWNYAEAGFPVKQVLYKRIKKMNVALLGFYYLKDVNNLSFSFGFHSNAFSKNNSPESFYQTPFLKKWRSLILKIQIPIRAVLWNVIFWQIGTWAYFILKKKINLFQTDNFLSVTMLGVLAYLTIFESGDRYVMQFWPVFLIVSSTGLCLQKREPSK
jgi:hypothetical protein